MVSPTKNICQDACIPIQNTDYGNRIEHLRAVCHRHRDRRAAFVRDRDESRLGFNSDRLRLQQPSSRWQIRKQECAISNGCLNS